MSNLGTRGEPVSLGLRERNRRRTKRRIADHAAGLFRRRGYENVRMADIAASAEVSEQTLYNYFPTKEHLIFDLDSEYEERIVAIVAASEAGVPMTRALREEIRRFLAEASRSTGKNRGLPTNFIASGPAVRRVWIELNARAADSVAEALIRSRSGKIHPAVAKIAARLIVSIFSVTLEELASSPTAGPGRVVFLRNLKRAIEIVIQEVEQAIPALVPK